MDPVCGRRGSGLRGVGGPARMGVAASGDGPRSGADGPLRTHNDVAPSTHAAATCVINCFAGAAGGLPSTVPDVMADGE